jgi:nucleotide-binding universal stress UspA family protein
LIAADGPSSVARVAGFSRVLVALDFAPSSSRALEAAARVVAPGGELRLLHVVEWLPAVTEVGMVGYGRTQDLRAMHADAEKKLAEAAATVSGPRVSTVVVEGQDAGTILDVADDWKADLIVIGARRRKDAGLRTGGVIEDLLKGAGCAVLVMPTGERT